MAAIFVADRGRRGEHRGVNESAGDMRGNLMGEGGLPMNVAYATPNGAAGVEMAEASQPWYVLHTRHLQERAVLQLLEANGSECFLPTTHRRSRRAGGPALLEVPLFPGYVFMRGQRHEAFVADRNRRLVQIIDVIDQDQLDRELSQIRLALEAGVDLEPHPQFVAGSAVRVSYGSLIGVQGVVEQHVSPHRLILQVRTLGQAVSVEVDEDALEPFEAV